MRRSLTRAVLLPELGRLAEEANQRFVWLARSLLRLVDWTSSPPDPLISNLPASRNDEQDLRLKQRLRELFRPDPQGRLLAARWLREHRSTKALPTLEGVLRIEEQEEVKSELARAVQELSSLAEK
jgi:hypothetical protein